MNARVCQAILISVVLILSGARASAAADQWLNQQFMPRSEARFKIGTQDIAWVHLPLRVSRVSGEWLWFGEGWVQKRHVVPIAQAESYYNDYLRRNRRDSWAWNLRGVVLQHYGKFEAALRDYSEAIRLDPNNANCYLNRAYVRDSLEDYSGAETDLEAAARAAPNDAAIHYDVGDFYLTLALDFWYFADDRPWEQLEKAGERATEKGITHLTIALRLDPSLKDVYPKRAFAYADLGNYALAIADYTQAIRLFPEEVAYYRSRGHARKNLGDYQGAIGDYEHYLEHTEESARTSADYYNLAWVLATCPYRALRNGPRAVLLATKACELSQWKSWSDLDALAAAYAETGDFASAVQWQSKAVDLAVGEDAKQKLRKRLELYQQRQPYREKDPSGKAPVAGPLERRHPNSGEETQLIDRTVGSGRPATMSDEASF